MKISKFLRFAFSFVGNIFLRLASRFYQSPQEKRVIPWIKAQGDKTLRLNYDLNSESMVFDLGGYEGDWASDIFSKYCCTIHVFEPVPQFAERIKERFKKNDIITVHSFGLAEQEKRIKINIERDGSSMYKKGQQGVEAVLVDATDFMKSHNIETVDLMKINIEGGEYDLLDHLIATGFIGNIKEIQIQFHDFVPNAEERMLRIQNNLEKTHYITYQYPFVWENWRRKGRAI